MSGLHRGKFLKGDELAGEYRSRKNLYNYQTISNELSIPDGWELYRENKKSNRIRKEKTVGRQLEDKVWVLLHNIGASRISTLDFTLELRKTKTATKTKQIDVVAIDDDIVFVVECKSSEKLGRKSLKKEIAEYTSNKKRIEGALRNLLGKRGLSFIHIFATENIEINENDKIDAKENGIVFWDEYDILALSELAKIAGEGAKYQIYNRIFHDTKIKGFDLKIPALKSKMGGITYYSFLIHPADLLKIAYVHHRTGNTSFMDLSSGYQRMIKNSKVRKIENFIQNGGFFPSSIIINFKRPLLKEEDIGSKRHLSQMNDAAKPVAITIPPYYGSAWVIDGQHRLYGFADIDEKERETLPVIAFVDVDNENHKKELTESLEAKIFVDINKNQTSIPARLLWDLYEDLYPESKNDKEQLLYAISMVAKKLNKDEGSPFKGHIEIPKEQNQGDISLRAICVSIKKHKLISPKDEDSFYREDYEETITFAAERIACFFDVFREEMPDEWEAGTKHYFRTNAGITVLMGILRDLLETNISRKQLRDIHEFRSRIKYFLKPLFVHFKTLDQEEIDGYRGAGGAGQKSNQVRRELTTILKDAKIGFSSSWLERYEETPSRKDSYKKHEEGLSYYLEQDESISLEFKGSLSINLDRFFLGDGVLTEDKKLLDEGVLKSIVAFLNSKKGGTVLIGIAEENKYERADEEKLNEFASEKGKLLIGIDIEYKKDEWDGFLLRLVELIQKRISSEVIDDELVKIKRIDYKEKHFCLIEVEASNSKQFLNDKFFKRTVNKTEKLSGKEIDKYWKSRQKQIAKA